MRILKSRPLCIPTRELPLLPSVISPEPHSEGHAKLRPCAEQNAHLCPSRRSQVSVPSLTGEEIGLCKSLIQSTLQKGKKTAVFYQQKSPGRQNVRDLFQSADIHQNGRSSADSPPEKSVGAAGSATGGNGASATGAAGWSATRSTFHARILLYQRP